MRANPWCLLALLSLSLFSGCVERRFVITSQPMGALVYYQGKPIGTTPCDLPFIYYGIHEFTFVKDGFETKTERYQVSTPWYQYPGVDVVTELFIPYMFRDVQHIHGDLMQAVRQVPNLVPRSLELRDRVKAIPSREPAPPPPGLPAMPPPVLAPGQVQPPVPILPPANQNPILPPPVEQTPILPAPQPQPQPPAVILPPNQ